VDMFRFKRILEIIEEDNLLDNCVNMGTYLKDKLSRLQDKYPEIVANSRGLGLFRAFDVKTPELRNQITGSAINHGLLILGCGSRSIRFRPPLCVNKEQIDKGTEILDKIISTL